MNKLMSSLVAATIVGAFSLSAIAADASKAEHATPAVAVTHVSSTMAEKPADAPKKHAAKKVASKKHAAKSAATKSHEAAA
ncbi:MAG: hypothetical protein GZ085_03050, partial [Sulfuriferula multivorans]|nr:hypothetical protein [Sulfuriferula multivorans]